MRIRVAGLVEMEGGFALMHRKNVLETPGTTKPFGEYYVFPGGGMEPEDKSLEDGAKREILEEFGIEVEVGEELCYRKLDDSYEEHLFLCKYVSGKLGTGTGPEFSGDPKYKDRGEYIPEVVLKENIKSIRLLPEDFKTEIIEKLKL